MSASYVNERWGRQRIVTLTGGDPALLVVPAGANPSLYDPTLAIMNFGYYGGAYNSQAATTTSQKIKYVRIRPQYGMTVSKVLSVSGTAVA